MRLSYGYVFLFFALVLVCSALLFPTDLDVVTLYRNSYLYPEAMDLLDQLTAEVPDDPQVALEQARVLYLVGRYERSLSILEKLSQDLPDDPGVWRTLAQNYRTVQEHRRALSAYESLLAHAPADSESLYLLEEYYRWFQEPAKRAVNLETLLTQFPQDWNSYWKLIDLYQRMGQGEDAAGALERAAAAFPDSISLREELAQMYLAQRNPKALILYDELTRHAPGNAVYLDRLVSALIVAGRTNDAISRFDGYYEPRLDRADFLQQRSRILVYCSKPLLAIQALEEKLELAPTPDTRLQLIGLYGGERQFDQAADLARDLVASGPHRLDYWQVYLDYLGAVERRAELVEALESCYARWPHDATLGEKLADAYEWSGEPAAALPLARQLFTEAPELTRHRYRLARVLVALGQTQAAGEHLSVLLKGDPGNLAYRSALLGVAVSGLPANLARTYADQVYALTGVAERNTALQAARLRLEDGDEPGATEIYSALRVMYGRSADLHTRIGRQLLDGQLYAAALASYQRALELAPKSLTALEGVANARFGLDPVAALPLLLEVESRTMASPDLLYRLAVACEAAGQPSRMKGYFTELLAATADAAPTDRYVQRQRARALFSTGDRVGAVDLLEALSRLSPTDADLANDLAELLIATGQHERAIEVLRMVPEL
jgi:tetratricopeptide (TPR) repeat protein